MNNYDWIDKTEYPFESNYLPLEMGKMHYVDEGEGQPIVMVHGNPAWSFLYRHFIKNLSPYYRCVAMDHIGFGLSDKPADWSYLPQDHAANLAALLDSLELKDITLVVQDWGGPIGLSYAVNNPQKVKRLVIINTWMWPVKGNPHYDRFSGIMGSGFGRFMIKRFNFFVNSVMKVATGDKSKLSPLVHNHYKKQFATPEERLPSWIFPREILGSTDWLTSLWEKRQNLQDKPALILWGAKDIAFREPELARWQSLLDVRKMVVYPDAGHYVQEEKGTEGSAEIMSFLSTL